MDTSEESVPHLPLHILEELNGRRIERTLMNGPYFLLSTTITVERTGGPVRRLVETAHQMQSCGRIVYGCNGIRARWLGNQLRTSLHHQKTKVSEFEGNPVSYIRRNQAGIGDVELLTKPHGNLQPKPTPRVEI